MMKRIVVFSAFFLMMAHPALCQVVGSTFPDLKVETVEDKNVNLPSDAAGKYTLIGMAYSKKSEDDLMSWFQPVYQKFIHKSTNMFATNYDVNIYFVPMFSGINAAATGTAKRKAVKHMDPALLPNILFYKGDLKPYKQSLKMEEKDIPYFFVLDPHGKIVHATSGKYSDEKMDEVEAIIEQ
jgi:hypothetical protein